MTERDGRTGRQSIWAAFCESWSDALRESWKLVDVLAVYSIDDDFFDFVHGMALLTGWARG